MTDNVKNEICVICLDEKRSPVALQCGHTFCSTCFTHFKSYQKYAWASRCPICRTTIMEKTRSVKRKASDSMDDRDARATVRPRLLSPPSTSTNVHQTIRQWAGNDSDLEEFLTLAVENDLEQGNRLDSAIDYLGTFFRERDTSVDNNNNNTSNATSQQNLVPPELVEQQEERSANENENETSENDDESTIYGSPREFHFYSPENEVEYENIAFGGSDSDSEGSDHEYRNYVTRDTSYLSNYFEEIPIEINSSHSNDSSNRADASTLNLSTNVLVINDEDTENELIESSTEQYIDLTSSSEQQQQQEQQQEEQQPQQQQQQEQQEDQHDSASDTDVIMTSPVMIRDVIIID